jgi:menaquinone-dependent protoporphyrinogen oxidase
MVFLMVSPLSQRDFVLRVYSSREGQDEEAAVEHPVLVTYATRYGSTAETARAVAGTLRESGLEVEIQPIGNVLSMERYCAVVLGAALYMGRLHKDARRFLMFHRDALSKVPVALFVPGPVEKREKDWVGAKEQLDKELADFRWLKPTACEIIGGAFDPTKLGFLLRLIPPLRKMPVSDARDWTAIHAWASKLAITLQPALQG